jgi:amino acid adenylation domain-containing protein/thioester reductase-like protein
MNDLDADLAGLFLTQVRRHPDRPAITDPSGTLTYAELGALARTFASGLRRMGLPERTNVGIAGKRGRDSCVAILGAVCAGYGYVPLDPSLPAERLNLMVTDSGVASVIRLPGTKFTDSRACDFGDVLGAGTTDEIRPTDAPAYVMFTSGTTGRPKAVAIPQRGVVRLAVNNGFMDIQPTDRVLHAASLSFDASVLEMWPALLNGACLVPVPSDVLLSAPALHAVVERERITVMFLTTSIFHHIAAERPELFARLRYAVTGGEALSAEAVRRVLEHGRPEHLVNAYGPTEAACVATAYEIVDVPTGPGVPIGTPIADTECYVVDGELCVAGSGIATGYLNATSNSFVDLAVDGRLVPVYRTGDIVRQGTDDVLEFVGRRDDQVKIRGFRIELDEIRAALTAHPGVGDAAVVVRGEGGTRVLAAYVTPGHADPQELLTFLRGRLPEYQVPATVTVLDRLPLAASGKLDRAALPEAVRAAPAATAGAVAETVAGIWASVLPGGGADFFASGGNSLLAVQLVAQVQQQLGIDDDHNYLLVTSLLNDPTVQAFVTAIEDIQRDGGAADTSTDRWRPDVVWEVPTVTRTGPEPNWRNPKQVFLTGATGFLGAHLLRELLDRTDAEILTLVRARDTAHAYSRLTAAQGRYGIDVPLPGHRVRPILGDLTEPRLGMREWDTVAAGVDVIHHCGAEVNFLYPYEKLRVANVYGTQEVLRLAARRAIPVHHVSTLAVVHGMGVAGVRHVTEDTPLDNVELLGMGYPESKWVAEEVVRAAGAAGLPVVIHRPYEISGDTTGFVWNSGAALCELFRIITEMGLAPDLDLSLNLVPVDYVARSIVHLGLNQPAEGQTYHLVNPREALLGDLVDRLRAHGRPIETIEYPAWTEAMLAHLAENPDHPFTPLTQLYTKRITPEVTLQELACARISPRLDRSRLDADCDFDCPPVDTHLLDGYVKYFHESGFIGGGRA